jgi:hypothetical protein
MRCVPSPLVGEGEDGGTPQIIPPPVSSPTRGEELTYLRTYIHMKIATEAVPEPFSPVIARTGRILQRGLWIPTAPWRRATKR